MLDVAAGPGTLTLRAAKLGAEVIATDFSASMIEQLRRHAAEENFANVTAAGWMAKHLLYPTTPWISSSPSSG